MRQIRKLTWYFRNSLNPANRETTKRRKKRSAGNSEKSRKNPISSTDNFEYIIQNEIRSQFPNTAPEVPILSSPGNGKCAKVETKGRRTCPERNNPIRTEQLSDFRGKRKAQYIQITIKYQ